VSGEGQKVVIIGAGHAGGSAAAFLREYGFVGAITLVGEEAVLPYQRPPLSKAWLKGETDEHHLILRPEAYYAGSHIDVRLATRAVAIDRANCRVSLANGEALSYDWLILATGSKLRRLNVPGAELAGILFLRTTGDADQLKDVIKPGCKLAVIGGGYIGLEVAACAKYLGADVTVIESEARVLSRTSSTKLAEFFQDYHRGKGVRFELNARVSGFVGRDGHVTGISLADGRTLACDAALVGIGATGDDELARAAGLPCEDGIVVDDFLARTADTKIFAIGDCTRRPVSRYGRNVRLESVPNAVEQAKFAAGAICGRLPSEPEVPWFWSDQFDLRLQIAGLAVDVAETVVRGDPKEAKFAVFHLAADGRLQAVEAVNATVDYMTGRLLIAKAKPVDRIRLADRTVPIKQLLG
jgi:3-phenylpropionate/trans-cinnamate dioxygenase ferredoxin reductase subunit